MVFAGIAVGWFAFGAAASARRPLGWAVACAVAAAMLEPLVRRASHYVPRPLAVVALFLGIAATAGSLTFGVLRDVDDEVQRLNEAAPEAAAELAESDTVLGNAAEDIDLETRVRRAVEELESPSSGVAEGVATSASAWFVCVVLTAFFLSWGPRLAGAGMRQIADDDVRSRVNRHLLAAVGRGRRYLLGSTGLAFVAGALAWAACDLENVPAPLALGVAVAAGSVIPGVGVMVGSIPAILLEAGLGTEVGALRLALMLLSVQLAHTVVLRRVVAPRSLVVGPAVIVIALVLGYDVYGVGGAYYTAALAVFGVAVLDAIGRDVVTRTS